MLLYLDPLSESDRAVVLAASEQFGVPVRVLAEGDDIDAALAEATSIVTQNTDLPAERLSAAAAPNLRLLQVMEFGKATVDRNVATARGVEVIDLLNLGWLGVCEHTMLLMLALVKQLPEAHSRTAAGERKPGVNEVKTTARDYTFSWLGQENLGWLYRKKLGIIGMGRIGQGVAARAAAFCMRISYASPRRIAPDREAELGARHVDLNTLLAESDFVSLHPKLTPETQQMFSAVEFGKMRPDAYFINTARGALVDEAALITALQSGQIAGAGIDVFEYEPFKRDNPLMTLSNVILTPHSAGIFNDDARRASLREAVERVSELP
jgi:phosphoglycerate dehydrogenase-like enzyme